MPTPAMAQAIKAPNTPVTRPKVWGSEKMPAPTIEPTTIAVNTGRENFCVGDKVILFPWLNKT